MSAGEPSSAGSWVARLASGSVQHRKVVLALYLGAIVLCAVIGQGLKFDAMPDITNNQVLILTRAPGLSPEEVERLLTRPLETAIGGLPGLVEQRSISRFGISSVTAVFEDSLPVLQARQVVSERLAGVDLPTQAERPQLGPITGGLGEIFHVSVTSPTRTPRELLELSLLQIAPRLRLVPGVVEVNSWGGQERTFDVRVDPLRLAARKLTLQKVKEALTSSIGSVAGTALPAGAGQSLLRATFFPQNPSELGGLLVGVEPGEVVRPLRVSEVAEVREGAQPRLGAATRNGQGETVYLMAQMLRGENALDVMRGLQHRLGEIRAALPPDVQIEPIYDRSQLVLGTLRTVGKNLLEGATLVLLVLLLLLGNLRAALLTALAIPLSMLGAAVGMVALGIPGNLMSLGALDFGLLVDGSVVMCEHLFHRLDASIEHDEKGWQHAVGKACAEVAQPVLFSVMIILLVYVPVLTLGGVEGKMFRPMAATVVFALFTSLLLALTFIPASASYLIRRADILAVQAQPPWLFRIMLRGYRPLLGLLTRWPKWVGGVAVGLLAVGLGLFLRAGSEFVPQLDEGDLVIQTTRHPDISLPQAIEQAGQLERCLLQEVPEVTQVVSRIGSPAVATDIMGLEQADVFVALLPRKQWRKGLSKEALIAQIESTLARRAPGGEPSFTQPIQMRFNEILAGAVSDVVISIFGPDLDELRRLGEAVERQCQQEPGAEDVKILAPPKVAVSEVLPRPIDAAQAGLSVGEVLESVQALRTGLQVGTTFDGPLRIPVMLRLLSEPPTAFALPGVPLPLPSGGLAPLSRVAEVRQKLAPSMVLRHNGERRLLVGFNVRGRDLGSLVAQAQKRVQAQVKLPPGYRIEWGGQYETLAAAKDRLVIVIPLTLVVILALLGLLFRRLRPAVLLFAHVPFACVGGMVALALRGMPVSISAAIGFIALSGIAVLNGVVLMSTLLELLRQGHSPEHAAKEAALLRLRPVLMTALVAALGFVPMMLAQGIGAEVQRPLATVVVGGLVTSTLLTLIILPTLYPLLAPRRVSELPKEAQRYPEEA
ncbi:MAG: efflux RND transporter permease subunit [Myxococcales bacterium]|nr:efflux RND transporter permease subunit [Myxococcales bacterium]